MRVRYPSGGVPSTASWRRRARRFQRTCCCHLPPPPTAHGPWWKPIAMIGFGNLTFTARTMGSSWGTVTIFSTGTRSDQGRSGPSLQFGVPVQGPISAPFYGTAPVHGVSSGRVETNTALGGTFCAQGSGGIPGWGVLPFLVPRAPSMIPIHPFFGVHMWYQHRERRPRKSRSGEYLLTPIRLPAFTPVLRQPRSQSV